MESSKAAVISIGKMSKRLKHPLLEFDSDEKEFVLGRNREAQCMILDVNVSRRHASLKHLSGQGWSITDNKALNGVYVNSRKIQPEKGYQLKHCDRFSLGPVITGYEWRFEERVKNENTTESQIDTESNMAAMNQLINANMQKALDSFTKEKETLEQRVIQEKTAQENLKSEKDLLQQELRGKREEFEAKQKLENEEFEKRLFDTKEASEQEKKELEEKLEQERKELDQKQSDLEAEMACKIVESEAKMAQFLKEKEASMTALQKEKDKMEEKLESERETFRQQLSKLEENNQESESSHLQKLEHLKEDFGDRLLKSQTDFEASVQKEKDEREKERQKLAEELDQKEAKIAQLNAQLQGVEDINAKKLKVDLLKKCNDELKCTICDELFIMPMALNCGHVFCQFCIKQWEWRVKTKKDFTCPNCRVIITTQNQSKHIENLISAIYRDIDETLSKEREDLIQERKLEIEKAVKPDPKKAKKGQNVRQWAQNVPAMSATHGLGSGPATATTSGGRRRAAQSSTTPATPGNATILVESTPNVVHTETVETTPSENVIAGQTESSSSSSSDSSDSNSDSDGSSSVSSTGTVEGHGYYGGYGSCYKCGHRGHWAPGCPFD